MPMNLRLSARSSSSLLDVRSRLPVALSALALALAGCGGHDRQWNSEALNTAVTQHLTKMYPQRDFSMSCPTDASLRAGDKVICRVSHLGALLSVVVTADSNNLHFVNSFRL
jgi:Domain of unknown function (DUF4333)